MSSPKNRKVRVRIIARVPKDPLKLFQALEKAFQPNVVDFQEKDDSGDKKGHQAVQSLADEQLEQKLVDKARDLLEDLAKAEEGSQAQKKQKKPKRKKKKKKKNREISKERTVATKRHKITTWVKGIIKEGYRITVKSLFEAALDKTKSI